MNWFDVVVLIIAPFVLCFSSFPILKRFSQFEKLSWNDKVLASIPISLTIILFPLFFVGIIGNFFVELSKSLFFIGIILIVFELVSNISGALSYIQELKKKLRLNVSLINFTLIISIIFFAIKYTFFLLIKAILDWDVSAIYLPIAREICKQNKIPLISQGLYFIKSPGISVIYAWIYANSSSLLAENFRLIPLLFIFITILLVYMIAKLFINENPAKLAVIVYIFMPIFDSSLFWFSFYPDILFMMLTLIIFYFLFKYIKSNENFLGVITGLALGLSSFLKLQNFWLFPVIVFTSLPLFKKKEVRLIIPLLTPFVILFGILPLSYLEGTTITELFTSFFNSIFRFDKILYFTSLLVLTILVIVNNESGIRTSGKEPKPTFLKMLIVVGGTSLPFYLIWYLRNYFLFGTFMWLVSIKNPNYQWALEILKTTTGKLPEGFFLSNLFFPLILPALGTAFLIPKVVGMIKLKRVNIESSALYVWSISYFLIYYLFTDIINERYLLPITPFLAIFSAIGIFFMVSYFTKSKDIKIMVLLSLFFGMFSLVQSRLIFQFRETYSDFFVIMCLKIVELLNVPWGILSGDSLSITNIWSQSLSLLFFGFIVFLIAVTLLLFVTTNKINIIVRVGVQSIPIKKCLFFTYIILITLSLLVTPYFSLAYRFSNGDFTAFKEKERLKYGFGNLYSEILPYLVMNAEDSDVVISVDTIKPGLHYYLKDIKIMDISYAENLAAIRNIIESNNTSEIFSALQNLKVRYILVSNSVLDKRGYLSEFLSPILVLENVKLSTGHYLFFKKVISGDWELYELQCSMLNSGFGPSITVFQNSVIMFQKTQYFYYDVSNITAYLTLSGHTKYNITGFPPYFSYEMITPSPSSISANANQWINFTGSSDVNYTIYWSNTDWGYQIVGWKDDSFLIDWVPIWGANFTTTGDVVTIHSPENEMWTHLKGIIGSVNLKEYPYLIIRIPEINGKVIFSGLIDEESKYLKKIWLYSPGTYIFDVSNVGTNCTTIYIYLWSDTTVKIDYIMFAAKTKFPHT